MNNGASNPMFDDPGAHASVSDFLHGRGGGGNQSPRTDALFTKNRYVGEDFESDRSREQFLLSWNPTGFLRRKSGEGWGDALRAEQTAKKEARGQQLVHARKSESLQIDQLEFSAACAISMNADGRDTVFRFDAASHGPVSGAVVFAEARLFCKHTLAGTGDALSDCAQRLRARCMALGASKHQAPDLLSSDYMDYHPAEDLLVPISPRPLNGALKHAVSSVFARHQAVVLDGSFTFAHAASRLRSRVSSSIESTLASLENATATIAHSRYRDVLCQWNTDKICRLAGGPLGGALVLDFVQNQHILAAVESILGTPDLLVDSVSLSIQWPGDSLFGPHVDRPFFTGIQSDNWPYSASMTPPRSSTSKSSDPAVISAQVIWCLDAFTDYNGAFFVVQSQTGSRRSVLTRRGDVIVASGQASHGAHPNYTPWPRVALLVQYVPRFVRPGAQFPRAVLDVLPPEAPTAVLERLLDLDLLDNDLALAVPVERGGGVETFVPPWDDARAASNAVIRAAVETFCDDGECADSLETEVYSRALLNHHGGSATGVKNGGSMNRQCENNDRATPMPVSFRLGTGASMPSLAFGTAGRIVDEVF